MQVKEMTHEGLARALQITVPSGELNARLENRLAELKTQANLPGFRPGKVPIPHLRRTYGQRLMGEIIQELVNETSRKTLEERAERPALQPEIKIVGEIESVMEAQADLVFDMAFEVIPTIKLTDFAKLNIERPIVDVDDVRINEGVAQLAESRQNFAPRGDDAEAQKGDRLTIDFVGRIDDKVFEGGSAESAHLVLGAEQFIPGFEDQLVGVKTGDTKKVAVTFPQTYGNKELAGKSAHFEVHVHEIAAPEKAEINDELATAFGLKDLAELRQRVGEQISNEYAQFSRAHMKKAMLDILETAHDFELPPAMVKAEFDQIWEQFTHEHEQKGESLDNLDEAALQSEYQKIAERRVRTGLVLAEVGNVNKITVSDEEVNRGVMAQAQQYRGQEQQVLEYFQNNPQARAQIRAPLLEEKVIDFISEMATITDKIVSIEDLMRDPTPPPTRTPSPTLEKKPKSKKAKPKKTK